MCRWIGLYFHNWIDYNGVAFSIDLLEDCSSYLRFANAPECLYYRCKVKWSSFNLKNESIHKNRK